MAPSTPNPHADAVVISARNVGKSYNDRPVLAGLDLEITEGEIFALLGPNGAGKTTTVEILEGYRRADEGEARVLGVDPVDGGAAFRSRIGIVLQHTTAFEQFTVAETVEMFAVLYLDPMSVADAIALVELTDQTDQLAVELSGGQRRRLEVACGLVGRPEVLFLDEPTTGLDPEARRRMWEIVAAVKDHGTTVLLTTHYLDEAEALADRIGILLGGRLREVADPTRIGGRSEALATVRYVPPDSDAGAEAVVITTETPSTVVADLVAHHGELPELDRDPTVTRRHLSRSDRPLERQPTQRFGPARPSSLTRDTGGIVMTAVTAPTISERTVLPSLWRTSLYRFKVELRTFRRVRDEVIFTFGLPIALLTLFASIFGGEIDNTGVDVSQYFVAGMLAATGITVGFQSLAAQLALEQHDGTLKRLAGTPMPKAAYMAGKIGMVVTVATAQTIAMFAVGLAFFDISLPSGVQGWVILVSVLGLNLAIWTLLGLAFSRMIINPRAGGAVVVPPTLILQFISGVYIPFSEIPEWLQSIASIFPLRWAALGLRQALLPDTFATAEPGGSWQTDQMYLILGNWLVVSAVLAAVFFRWRGRE